MGIILVLCPPISPVSPYFRIAQYGESMFTLNGLKKVKCDLVEKFVVVNGVNYEVMNVKNTDSARTQAAGLTIFLLILNIYFGAFMYFYRGPYSYKGQEILMMVAFVTIFTGLLFSVHKFNLIFNCRSIWQINIYHTIYIEKIDDYNIEANLKKFPITDDVPPQFSLKAINKFDCVLLVILFIIFNICYFYRKYYTYWAETMLVFPCYLVYIRIKDIYYSCKNLKW